DRPRKSCRSAGGPRDPRVRFPPDHSPRLRCRSDREKSDTRSRPSPTPVRGSGPPHRDRDTEKSPPPPVRGIVPAPRTTGRPPRPPGKRRSEYGGWPKEPLPQTNRRAHRSPPFRAGAPPPPGHTDRRGEGGRRSDPPAGPAAGRGVPGSRRDGHRPPPVGEKSLPSTSSRITPLLPFCQPLVAPAVRPEMKYRCIARKKRAMGRAINTDPAANTVKFWPNLSLINPNNPTASVHFSGLDKTIRGSRKSVIGPMKLNRATTAIIGRAKGSMIRKKTVLCPAPSMRAASSRLLGIVSKYPFTSQVL